MPPLQMAEWDTPLPVPFPHDAIYVKWLLSQIDLHNGDFERYNNALVNFHAAYQAFVDSYNRAHMPRQDCCIRI